MKAIRFMTEISYNMHNLLAAKASFEQANPGVKVIVEQSKDYFEMAQAWMTDEAPDIIETGGFPVGNLDGLFIDLNPYVAEVEGLENDLYTGLMRVARNGGILPALPIEISPPLILYNKLLFDRAGLSYPNEDWTWDEMIDLAKKLTIRDEQGVASQFGFWLGLDIEWWEPFVMRNGGAYISPDGSTSRGYVDSEATIAAFRLIVDAFRIHSVIRKPNETSNATSGYEENAMAFHFNWNCSHLFHEQPEENYGVVGLPNMPGGVNSNMVYMGGAGITTKSADSRLAWDFLRHYLLECHSWNPPAIKSQAAAQGLTGHRIWSRYLDELEYLQISGFFLNRKWNSGRQLINEDIYKMVSDGADVAQTLRSWTRYT